MPRKPLIRCAEYPYHVVARANNRGHFELPLHQCWEIILEKLQIVSDRYESQIISFVLMSNHLHLLLYTPSENLDEIMEYFLKEVSRTFGKRSAQINHTFGGPYKWCLIKNDNYFANAYKYLYRNPVHASITSRVELYPFSTIRHVVSDLKLPFKLFDDYALRSANIPKAIETRLAWLNNTYSAYEQEAIRRALRHRIFAYPSYNQFSAVQRTLEFQR